MPTVYPVYSGRRSTTAAMGPTTCRRRDHAAYTLYNIRHCYCLCKHIARICRSLRATIRSDVFCETRANWDTQLATLLQGISKETTASWSNWAKMVTIKRLFEHRLIRLHFGEVTQLLTYPYCSIELYSSLSLRLNRSDWQMTFRFIAFSLMAAHCVLICRLSRHITHTPPHCRP